jgi:Domain of Unknown Function (DUF928)
MLAETKLLQFSNISSRIIAGLITTAILILVKQDASIAEQLMKKKSFRLPPIPHGRGIPRNRTVSFSMGGQTCRLDLVALAPEFQNPKDVWGETTTPFPILWFSVNAAIPSKTKLEFSLQDEAEKSIFITALDTPQQPGIIGIKITKQPLEINKTYHWTLKTIEFCDESRDEPSKFVSGFITMVKENDDGGIWYDNVTNIAQQLLLKPNDMLLIQWRSLLKDVDLEELTKQPLLSIVDVR